jgi:hypothetical protein
MKLHRRVLVTASLLFAFPVATALADKLSDFKDADRYDEGCDTIPASSDYSSDRSACFSQQPSAKEWCDGARGPNSCGNESLTPNLRKALTDVQGRIADIKDKKRTAENNRSNAKDDEERKKYDEEIKQLENDLYKATNDEAAAKQALEQRGKDVEAAIYAIDQCITYRKAVLNVFASSLDKMRNEKETPEIEAVAYSLKGKYDAAKSGHQRQITTREDAMSICKKARP